MVLVGDGTGNLKDEPLCVCVCVRVHMRFQSCPALCDPVDSGLPGFSLHGISQARILEWVAISSSRGSSRLRMSPGSLVSPALAGRFFTSVRPRKPKGVFVTSLKRKRLD